MTEERNDFENIKIPISYEEKKELIRDLMNIRPPNPISDEFLEIQNLFLRNEIKEKEIVPLSKIPSCPKCEKISLWKGDITLLKVDGILNAANS